MKKILLSMFIAISMVAAKAQYVPFRLEHRDNSFMFGQTVNRLNDKNRRAIELRNQILKDLADVELNIEDDKWKSEYIEHVKKKIDNTAPYGSYAQSISTIEELAEEVFADPELVTRYRANKIYIEWKQYAQMQMKKDDYTVAISNIRNKIVNICQKEGTSINYLDYHYVNNAALGNALFTYANLILLRPTSYKDWLYLLYLATKCHNGDATRITNELQLMKYQSMMNGHSTTLFSLY